MRPAGNVDSFIGDDIANYRIAGLTAFTRSDSPRLTRGWKRAINAADHRLLRGTKHVFRVNATAFITRAVLRPTLVTVRFVVTAIFGGMCCVHRNSISISKTNAVRGVGLSSRWKLVE